MLAHNQRLQRLFGGGFSERLFLGIVSSVQVFFLGRHKDPKVVQLVRRARRERRSIMTAYEAYMVYSLAKAYHQLPGDMAEVGVYQGASAKLLCGAKGDKHLHLFDTFEGSPKASQYDGAAHSEKQYTCSLESVRAYLRGYENVHFYKGRFPESAGPLKNRRFSFVHFDLGLYEGTLACLDFFYPRMLPGGVMLLHDYSLLAGVRKAVDEFLRDRPERPIELPSTQCMVVKLGNG
jgi:hypothetical protein